MYKLILHDYRIHWRSSLRRVYDSSALAYVCLFFTLMSLGLPEYSELPYICLVIPCFLAYILARMYGGHMNKTFFLCPLDINTRRQYAEQSFRLRIFIPSVLFILLNVILMFCGFFSFVILLIRLFAFGCTAISVNIYWQPTPPEDIFAPNQYPFTGNFEALNTYSHIINIVLITILMHTAEYSITEFHTWELVIIGILMILQLATTIRKYKRFYQQSIVLMDFYK